MYKNFTIFIKLAQCIENICQFIALIFILGFLVFIFYIIFALGNANSYLSFLDPFVENIKYVIELFWKGSEAPTNIHGYMAGLILLAGGFCVFQFLKERFEALGKFLIKAKEDCRRFEDKQVNEQIHKNIDKMNDKITKAIVYIELKPKERTVEKVNLEEQYLQLNNFLYSKLGLAPIKYGNGYIYKFLNFKTIDLSLKTFMKAINSEAPVDYMVILQAYEGSEDFAYMEIFKLRTTGIYNTIIMAPTTNIRYEYIKDAVYTTGIIGRYMIENDDVSIYEIREKFF